MQWVESVEIVVVEKTVAFTLWEV
ncbi:hypothetical protein LYNGBM3L_00980 [Moorena producens 3L]|uniref:Uncharacterized protein n=1 Tax=Moorena producens 3L TaxID=489825 RepID=F4XRJ0_9CYAN|nr:hypothetical protein LYNGBM3L_00980 [Moorena producens 3L]